MKYLKHAASLALVAALAACGQQPPLQLWVQTASFDPLTKTGFVGKGDVQVPFGWNNAQLQTYAEKVAFLYADRTEYEIVCQQVGSVTETNPAGRLVTKPVFIRNTSDANTTVAYDSTTATKKNPKGSVTGFNINGATLQSTESPPAAGSACKMDDGSDGTQLGGAKETGTTGDTLTAIHTGQNKSAVVWTDGVSSL